jgi:hypothetical protein
LKAQNVLFGFANFLQSSANRHFRTEARWQRPTAPSPLRLRPGAQAVGNAGQTAAATVQRRVAGHRGIDRQCCCSGVRSPGEQPQYFRERDREDRAPRALFYSVLSYAGTYSINGNVVTHHVDVSWNEPWTGSDQTRNVRLEGDADSDDCGHLFRLKADTPGSVDFESGSRSRQHQRPRRCRPRSRCR